MTRNESIRFIALRSLGNFLVLFSLYGVFATFGPALSYELQYRIIQLRGITFTVQAQDTASHSLQSVVNNNTSAEPAFGRDLGFADILAGEKNQQLSPKDSGFSILIPKIGASAKVFPNVSPEDPNEFKPVLQQGVAHAKGSVFPGFSGTTYLFAHSADNWWDVGRYNAIFYTLNNLSDNDEIVIFFENKRYDYVVTKKMVAEPQDVSLLTARHEGPQQLVLQTCWPPGTTWKRLYIVAAPKSSADQ